MMVTGSLQPDKEMKVQGMLCVMRNFLGNSKKVYSPSQSMKGGPALPAESFMSPPLVPVHAATVEYAKNFTAKTRCKETCT